MRRELQRFGPRAASLALVLATVLGAASAWAIETGPPQLPPPPPPPVQPQPVQPQPAPQPKPSGAPAHSTTTSSPPPSSTGSTVTTTSGDSSTSGGALDTRWAIAGMAGLSTDCLGFGLGVRGGKTFDNHLYVGGSFVYHFPGCAAYGYQGYYGNYSYSGGLFYFGPEVGYDFDLKAVVLRAYMGLGGAFLNSSWNGPGPGYNNSTSEFVVWPGASVFWDIPGSAWFIGGDVRFVSVWGGPAVGFFFTGGIHLGT